MILFLYILKKIISLPYYLLMTLMLLIVMWGEWVEFKLKQIKMSIRMVEKSLEIEKEIGDEK